MTRRTAPSSVAWAKAGVRWSDAALAGAVVALATVCAGPASALECPVAHAEQSQGVIRETPETIARLSQVLDRGGAEAAGQIISTLRTEHPEATDGAILNFLLTAYCPAVDRRTDLTERQKRTRLQSFQRAMSRRLFARN